MTKNKKIATAVIAVVVAVALFAAGYFISSRLSAKKGEDEDTQTTAQQEETTAEDNTSSEGEDEKDDYLYILEDEKLGSGKLAISKAEYEYYCISIYNSLISNAFQYDLYYGEGAGLQYTGFDWRVLPEKQKCALEADGKKFDNYQEYIEHTALKQLIVIKGCMDYAELNSITLDEDELKEVNDFIEGNRQTISEEGKTMDEYLKEFYGEGMSEELYTTVVKEQYLLNKVDMVKSDLLEASYTDEMVEAEYNSNVKHYGQVTLRNYIIVAATDDSGAVYEASMDAARDEAEVFAEMVTDEESFKQQVSKREEKNGNTSYAEILIEDNYTLLKNIYYDELDTQTDDEGLAVWAFDSSRKAGDIYIAKVDGVGYGVFMMVDPLHKPATEYTYDVRHILIELTKEESEEPVKAELLNPADYGVTVDIAVSPATTAEPATYMKAQGILEQYLAGECTEESFGELAKTNSADGNAAQGGIYTDVPEGQMVSAFENWALAEGRKAGDVGIVETRYGYHIMYFVGRKEVSDWTDTVKEEMVYNGVEVFVDDIYERYEASVESINYESLNEFYQHTIDNYIAYMGG